MGCGRLFEGSAAQMYANLQRLAGLPDETQVYCAHEYTLSNGRFALTVEPDNAGAGRADGEVEAARAAGEATVPTTIALERATNPFMRAPDRSRNLPRRRAAKDGFRGRSGKSGGRACIGSGAQRMEANMKPVLMLALAGLVAAMQRSRSRRGLSEEAQGRLDRALEGRTAGARCLLRQPADCCAATARSAKA